MNLQIKTLSPIHIGNGEKYNGLSYIQDKRQRPTKVCYLEFEALQKTLNQQQLQDFSDWVVTERFPSLYKYLKNIVNDRNNSIANNLIPKSLYKVDLLYKEDPQQRRFLGDIDAFIKQNNKVYIPGTELKGAIRTAVLYHLLNIESNYYNLLKGEMIKLQNNFNFSISIISTGSKRGRDLLKVQDLKHIPQDEFNRLFGRKKCDEIWRKINNGIDPSITVNKIKGALLKEAGKIEDDLQNRVLRGAKSDAKYDLLKLLHISDTELKEPSKCLFVSDLKVENTKQRDRQGNSTDEDIVLFQELCKKDQIFTCQGFKLDNNRTILEKLGFSDEQKHVVSDVRNLLRCCYEFSNRLLDEELSYQQYSLKIKDRLNTIRNENKPDSPVIRIGKNEGYLSLTIGLIVKDKDKSLYDNVLCHATKNTSYTGNFPKTRRIVNLENGDVDTCGWVKLTTTD